MTRRRHLNPVAVLLIVLLLMVAGCGSKDKKSGTPKTTATPDSSSRQSGRPTPIAADLKLTFTNVEAMKDGQVLRVKCNGKRPIGSIACARLAEDPKLLDPLPKGRMCTEQYGGPEVLSISGTLGGKPVQTQVTRKNGCEIARFEKLRGLWIDQIQASLDGRPPSSR